MYIFAVALLLGLGVMALAAVADRFLSVFHELWAVAVVAIGIGLAWLANFNMWAQWGLEIRAAWIGVTLTGLALAGIAYFWRETLGLVGAMFRKLSDEAEELERTHGLRRVA